MAVETARGEERTDPEQRIIHQREHFTEGWKEWTANQFVAKDSNESPCPVKTRVLLEEKQKIGRFFRKFQFI